MRDTSNVTLGADETEKSSSQEPKASSSSSKSSVPAAKVAASVPATTSATTTKSAAATKTTKSTNEMKIIKQRALRTSLIVLATSLAGAVAFTTLGILQAKQASSTAFHTRATELGALMQATWKEYEHAALSLHNICRRDRNTTRREFRDFYEYLIADTSSSSSGSSSGGGGLEFESAQCSPNVTHAQRSSYEDEARMYYAQHYPTINYTGIVGFVTDNVTGELTVVPNSPIRDFYFPVHYLEPVLPNAAAIELDMYSFPSQKLEIDLAVSTRQPVLSKRLHVVQEWQEFAYSVIIYHPGIWLPAKQQDDEESSTNDTTAIKKDEEDPVQDLSLILVRIPSLLHRVALVQKESLAVYLYDTTILNTNGMPEFLGAGAFTVTKNDTTGQVSQLLTTIPEIDYKTFVAKYNGAQHNKLNTKHKNRYYYESTVPITPSGTWIVAVVPADDDTYQPNLLYVLFGGIMILGAGLVVATWIYMNAKRDAVLSELRLANQAERAALIVKNAEEAAQTERELNDFLAHEVRNPLTAAISASSFITAAVHENEPLSTHESITSVREDIGVINSSLQYVNDLLRNMLDMHKASCDQLHITLHPADLRKDILDPVAAIIYHKSKTFTVEIDCIPEDLVVSTDRIRLKQIVLNLASNSCKFVERGFVRLGAKIHESDGTVVVLIEDSGPGIPLDKRDKMFEKFQASLDSLNQGTGIGLSLCKSLAELLGGEVFLDESYDSGIEGCPGARFVVRLNIPPLDLQKANVCTISHHSCHNGTADGTLNTGEDDTAYHAQELPTTCRVLFVDDDVVVRKLFARAVKRVAPTWDIDEAANGETALKLVEKGEHEYDLIFLDQYMASIQKQMLGTEVVPALRSKGFKGRICGISANSMEQAFLTAGANAFMFKPFPCEPGPLRMELCRVLFSDDSPDIV